VNEALLHRIDTLAATLPTLILIEDAHWADAATVDLVTALVPRLSASRIMLLVTHRPEFQAPWPASDRIRRISLGGIDLQAGDRLLGMVAGGRTLPPAVAKMILEKAGGVPLFVEELAKTVLDSVTDGAMVVQGNGPIAIPATLQDSLMARLDRLGPAKELAQLGSVIGREFNAEMLRIIAPDNSDIEDGLRRLCASGLAFERAGDVSGAIVFHHALIQDTAYEALLKKRRREIHRAIAEAMLAGHEAFAGTEPETVARHCSRGGLDEAAMQHWLMAGLHALDRAANAPAMAYLNAALEHLERLPEDETRAATELKIQMALAPATMAIDGWAAPAVARTCLRARSLAVDLGDGASLFGATWGLWTNYFLRGEMDPALETAEAVDMMAEGANQDVLRVTADHAVGFTRYFRGELDLALERADRGIGRYNEEAERYIVRMFQFSSTTALYGFRASSLWMKGRDAEASEALRQALELPDHLGHAPSIAFSLAFTQYTLMYMRDWKRVRETSMRLIRISEREGFRMWIPQAGVFLGLCDAADGKLDRGLQRALDSFNDYVATGTGLTLSQLVPSMAEFLIEAGRAREAIERLDQMIAAVNQRREVAYASELYRARAQAKRAIGAEAEALADAKEALRVAVGQSADALVARANATLNAVKDSRADAGR
jgi:tetratricopeptide (TPR) repeat protein